MSMNPPDDSQQTHAVLDLSVIEELRELGGEEEPDLVLELIGIFLEDTPKRLAEMTSALEEGNLEGMLRAAHTLKSSAANMGGLALRDVCIEMERTAKAGERDEYQRLTAECQSAFAEFEKALGKLA